MAFVGVIAALSSRHEIVWLDLPRVENREWLPLVGVKDVFVRIRTFQTFRLRLKVIEVDRKGLTNLKRCVRVHTDD